MLKAIRLRTEYLENPLGIDIEKPRFGWNLEGDGKRQNGSPGIMSPKPGSGIRRMSSAEYLKKMRTIKPAPAYISRHAGSMRPV